MITGAQVRMARGYLRWSVEDLAKTAGVGISTIRRMEDADGVPQALGKNLEAGQRALEAQGVEFTNGEAPGVRLRK